MSIARGDDGGLWLAFNSGNSIARMSTSGTVTLYQPESAAAARTIANGPDGRIWFATELGRIGSMAYDGTPGPVVNVAAEVPLVMEVVAGPDGNVWATLYPPPRPCTLTCPPPDATAPLGIARVNLHTPPRRRAVR